MPIVIGLLMPLLAIAGFVVGQSGGMTLASAREDGARAGSAKGAKRGYQAGFKAGYNQAERAAYVQSRNAAYRELVK